MDAWRKPPAARQLPPQPESLQSLIDARELLAKRKFEHGDLLVSRRCAENGVALFVLERIHQPQLATGRQKAGNQGPRGAEDPRGSDPSCHAA